MAPPARSRLRAQIGLLVAALAISALGAVVWSRTVADDAPEEVIDLDQPGEYVLTGTNPRSAGRPLPDIELLGVDGAGVALRPTDGRPMVVNLWYSTCPPCARELVAFAEVHDEVGDRVRFVGVNPLDPADEMVRFAGERGVTYELLRDPDALLDDALRVVQYPVTLFVDAEGTIVDQTGPLDADGLRARIEALI